MGENEPFLIENGVLVAYLGDDPLVEIPAGVTAIGDAAFLNNTTMTGVVIPESVTMIGVHAFRGCTGLNGVLTLPEKLTSI